MFDMSSPEMISWEVAYADRASWFGTLCDIRNIHETPDRDDAARRASHASDGPTGRDDAPQTLQ